MSEPRVLTFQISSADEMQRLGSVLGWSFVEPLVADRKFPSNPVVVSCWGPKASGKSTFLKGVVATHLPEDHAFLSALGIAGNSARRWRGREYYRAVDLGFTTYPLKNNIEPRPFTLEKSGGCRVRGRSGKSMEPVYREGARIVLSPAEKPRRGDRVAVRTRNGEVMVKQLGRDGGQKIELLSFNPDYPLITLLRRDVDWIYRVVWASQ